MSSAHRPRTHSLEAELKFRLTGAREQAAIRAKLRALGAKRTGMYDEENVRYRPVRRQTVTLRLRILDGGPRAILTAKGPARYERRIKIREETEVVVEDAESMLSILSMLGHQVAVVYHKHRESWRLNGCDVTLDTLDFGLFSEVEGPVDQIEGTAARLGLGDRTPLKSSYSELARNHAKAQAG